MRYGCRLGEYDWTAEVWESWRSRCDGVGRRHLFPVEFRHGRDIWAVGPLRIRISNSSRYVVVWDLTLGLAFAVDQNRYLRADDLGTLGNAPVVPLAVGSASARDDANCCNCHDPDYSLLFAPAILERDAVVDYVVHCHSGVRLSSASDAKARHRISHSASLVGWVRTLCRHCYIAPVGSRNYGRAQRIDRGNHMTVREALVSAHCHEHALGHILFARGHSSHHMAVAHSWV